MTCVMPLMLEERALRRYAARYGGNEVRVVGGRVEFRLEQELSDAEGQRLGLGAVVIPARRQFGGMLEVLPAELSLGGAPESELDFLQALAGHLVATLEDLCRCGRFRAECDCCSSCSGTGIIDGGDCGTCAGLGYGAGGKTFSKSS